MVGVLNAETKKSPLIGGTDFSVPGSKIRLSKKEVLDFSDPRPSGSSFRR